MPYILYVLLLFGSSNGMENGHIDTNLISGKELKVLIMRLGTATIIFQNASGEVIGFGGFYYEQLVWLSQKLNFSLSIVVEKTNSFGRLVNGTWSGMRGYLQRGEVDLACAPFVGNILNRDILEMSVYVLGNGFGILGKYPNPETSVYGIVKIFSPNVWIGLILSIFVCIGSIKLLDYLSRKFLAPSNDLTSLSKTVMFVFANITNHSGNYQSDHRSVGLISLIWILASFVLVTIYSSCLSSFMSLTTKRPDINSFEELANNPDYQLTNFKGTYIETMFLEAETGIMKAIGDKLRRCNDECSLTSYDRIVEKIFGKQPYVAVIALSISDNYMFSTMINRQCRLTIGQETTAFQHYHMASQKNSPYAMELKKASFLWHSLGLHNYWFKYYNPEATRCRLSYNSQGESVELVDQARIQLKQFYLAFLVLFIGYILAFIQFVRERFIH